MFDFFTKVKQQMTGLDDANQQTETVDTLNVQALGNAMSTVFQKFVQINQSRSDSSFVSERIQEINERGVKFREYANESISQSDKLLKYAEEVVVFAVARTDSSFTNEELLDFLNSTLEDARKNKVEAENLKVNISGVIADLINIQNECTQYSLDIQRDPRTMDSEVASKLKSEELKKKILNTTFKIGTGVAALGAAVSIIAAPSTGGISLAIPLIESVEGGLLIAATGVATSIGSKFASNSKKKEVNALGEELVIKRDELVGYIGLLNGDLESIIHNCCNILNFWEEQISSLSKLIEGINSRSEERLSRLDSMVVQRKWNNISRECKEYNRTVRAALQTSNMTISN